jgi:hypothetical protein
MAEDGGEILKRLGTSREFLNEGSHYPSPFSKVLGLGYYDGPTNGLLECTPGGQVFKFDLLDNQGDPEGLDLRVFGLAQLPSTALTQLAEAYARFWSPRWPVWVPVWHFPSREDQEAMERLTEQILGQAGPVQWVIAATGDLLGEIIAAKRVTPDEVARITDWFSFLGIARQPAAKE